MTVIDQLSSLLKLSLNYPGIITNYQSMVFVMMEPLPRRSDTTTIDSVYSSGPTQPASLTRALAKPTMERLRVDASAATVFLPSQLLALIASPQTPSPRDLQRQQEVRDRLSWKAWAEGEVEVERTIFPESSW